MPAIVGLVASLVGGGGGSSAPAAPKPAAPAGPTTQQAQAAITPQALSIESATGGSVSPDYLSQIAPVLAGVGGQPNTGNAMQQVLQQLLGNKQTNVAGAPVNLNALAATPGTSDFLTKIAGGL